MRPVSLWGKSALYLCLIADAATGADARSTSIFEFKFVAIVSYLFFIIPQ
jgi:hypothetical protein